MRPVRHPALLLLPLVLAASAGAQPPPSPAAARPTGDYVPPEISGMTRPQSSELRDRDELVRFYSVNGSAAQVRRLREFYAAWSRRLEAMPYESLGTEGRVDWLLMARQLDYCLKLLDREVSRQREMSPLIPFSGDIAKLQESRLLMEPVDPQ